MASGNARERLLESARKLFSEKGFKSATTAEISRNAGVSEVTMYRHFKNKQELLMECVKPVLTDIIQQTEHHAYRVDNLRNFAIDLMELRLRIFEEHYDTMRIVLNELPYSGVMLSLYLSFLKKQEEIITRTLAKMEDLGKIRRLRNVAMFGLGQFLALWFFLSFKNLDKGEEMNLTHDLLNISEEHITSDLADFFLYGISGVPEEEAEEV